MKRGMFSLHLEEATQMGHPRYFLLLKKKVTLFATPIPEELNIQMVFSWDMKCA